MTQTMYSQRHPFHLVNPSPWPLVTAMSALVITSGLFLYMHSYFGGHLIFPAGLLMLIFSLFGWWKDVVREATYDGHHTVAVQVGLRYGVILFIISEVFFFIGFFWAFFHSSLSPTVEIGLIWPPKGIEVLDPWSLPFLNTLILLTSGVTVTWAHYAVLSGRRGEAISGLFFTVLLGLSFSILQMYEYKEAAFAISDGIYGSTFYMATGFHGAHVIIGTIFLLVCLVRQINYHFTREHHLGFEAAAWYWHFVDVVWLFLFTSVYWWGR